MSDRVVQSVWMARWMRASSDVTEETCDLKASRNAQLHYATKDDGNFTKVKDPDVIETNTFKILNESCNMSSKSMENEGMRSVLFKYGQGTDRMQASKDEFGYNFMRSKAANDFISSAGCPSLGEGTSKNPLRWTKAHSAAKDGSFAMPLPYKKTFVESSSHTQPHRFNLDTVEFGKGKAAESPLISRSAIVFKQLPNANLTILEHELRQDDNQSVDLVLGKKMDCYSQSRNGCYSLQKLHNCVHDVEAMRIFSTMDSAQKIPGGASRFLQTTHSLLITKKTDVNLSNVNTSTYPHRLSPFFSQGSRGVKIQSLSSSTDSEGKENVRDVKASKITSENASLAEMGTMDLDSFEEKNPHSGAYSTTSTKAFNMPPPMDVASSTGCPQPITGLADINLELPALPAAASLSGNTCTSSSRTQSLDMDKLLAHAVQPISKLDLNLDDPPDTDPGDRWVKRLKLSSSNSSGQGTKVSNVGENLSHEKMSKYFSRILKSTITSSETTAKKLICRGPIQPNKEDLAVETEKKSNELLLSHAWIQRWLSDKSRIAQKKPDKAVTCEPQSSKLAVENLQKDQFPSIAAMALMGKAITGFPQCEPQKRGSFTVWKTKAF